MGGGPLHLSPNFEARFSRIDIAPNDIQKGMEASPRLPTTRSPKKKYPQHIFPGGTGVGAVPLTPACLPNLSTARRAESRHKNNTQVSPSSRQIDGTTPKTPVNQSRSLLQVPPLKTRSISVNKQLLPPKRAISYPMSQAIGVDPTTTRPDYQFSFMRGTSSSAKKKVSPTPIEATSPTQGRTTNVKNKDIHTIPSNNTSTSNRRNDVKRLDYTMKRRPSGKPATRPRRINSYVGPPSVKPEPTATSNYSYDSFKFTPKSSGRRTVSSQPSEPPINRTFRGATRNTSQPLSLNSDDVYSRLYNNSYKRKVSSTKNNIIPNAAPTANSMVQPTIKDIESDNRLKKVQNLKELYNIIYERDPLVFQATDSQNLEVNDPIQPHEVIGDSTDGGSSLTIYERGEIIRRKDIYYFLGKGQRTEGHHDPRDINIKNYDENFGFDDKNGNYLVVPHDHINYRYEIINVLGNGSFGNVVKCKDHKYNNSNKYAAVKIIKSELNWSLQAVYEIKMLKHLNEAFRKKCHNEDIQNFPILAYYDHFHFRGHMCIVTEVLSLNLFSLIEMTSYRGFSLDIIKHFSSSILKGLEFIHKENIIHCDIKPENIMIKVPSNFNPNDSIDRTVLVKIIDFGSSCFSNEISYSYIQSRYYRAPEVVLGAKYTEKIDLWSFGCVIAELFTGTPLLPGKNELEQIGLMLELFGAPNSSLILNYRSKLLKSIEEQKSASKVVDPAAAPTSSYGPRVDEKSIKKTLLYSLFDMGGKINLQFLNLRLQAVRNHNSSVLGPNSSKRFIKLNSKILDVLLKVSTANENKKDIQNFLIFLQSIFQWDPASRPSTTHLLASVFLE